MTNELSTERAIEALYTVRAYYASLTVGYPKGKDRRGIGDVMCSEIANSCLMAIEALEQEPCEDCISRAWLKEAVHNFFYGLKHTPTEEDMQAYIDAAPPVTPQPRWIPCSERLPKSAGVYIVTREFTDGFECADLTDACYFDGTSTWHNDNRINHGREYVDKKIKAWMSLPEPYKAESEG